MEMKSTKIDAYYNQENENIKEYDILKKFKSHNILSERVDLYKDFSLNLLYCIYDTYLGVDYIKNEKDAKGHYNWCFGKILEQFYDQEIDFFGNDELYYYFLEYYLDQFYPQNKENDFNDHKKLFLDVFNHKKINKNKREFEVLIELYVIFDKSLDNKNKMVATE